MLIALLYLDSMTHHYPIIRKRYTVFNSQQNCFKLINPFCFSDYLRDSFKYYFNDDCSFEEKKKFQKKIINRNVKEFGIMILALIKNIEELEIY